VQAAIWTSALARSDELAGCEASRPYPYGHLSIYILEKGVDWLDILFETVKQVPVGRGTLIFVTTDDEMNFLETQLRRRNTRRFGVDRDENGDLESFYKREIDILVAKRVRPFYFPVAVPRAAVPDAAAHARLWPGRPRAGATSGSSLWLFRRCRLTI
jgi:hypothetical protein